jgi:hypothetical protein
MSAVSRLPMMAGTLSAAASVAAIAGIPSLRQRVTEILGKRVSGNMLGLVAIAFALLNLKNLPFVWHVRPPDPPNQPIHPNHSLANNSS